MLIIPAFFCAIGHLWESAGLTGCIAGALLRQRAAPELRVPVERSGCQRLSCGLLGLERLRRLVDHGQAIGGGGMQCRVAAWHAGGVLRRQTLPERRVAVNAVA